MKGNLMITMLNASTFEIDDPDGAVDDILGQIDGTGLKANSVGILSCNLEFLLNGTVQALCEKLPFDVVGSTTTISDICGEADEDQLSLLVMTSDSASFSAAASAPLGKCAEKDIADLYDKAAQGLPGKAGLGIFFGPFLFEVGADAQVCALDKASGGIPMFGMIALDYIFESRDPRAIYNGADYKDCMALLLISDDVEPRFFVESISPEKVLQQKAIVTSSEGNILKSVNDMPAIQYLETLGLAHEGTIESIPLVPLSVDTGDGARPIFRAIFAVTPDGHVICGGDMPEKAILGVGSIDAEEVQATTTKLATEIMESGKANGAILFSCIARNRALGLDPMHEIERLQSVFGDSIPYLFMYAGGEIYPDIVEGKALNKALNDSIIACVF